MENHFDILFFPNPDTSPEHLSLYLKKKKNLPESEKQKHDTLRKHAHVLKLKNFENFRKNFFYIFLIFAQNIDCGYTLEPPRRGGSNEYPQSMFWSKNKNQRTNGPVNAHLSLLHIPINMFEYYGI